MTNSDPGSQSMRRAKKVSGFLPQIFSNVFVSIVALLASGLMLFLALMGYLNLEGMNPGKGILAQIEVIVFLTVVGLSTIVIALFFINLMFVIAGNTAEQAERISTVSARDKMKKIGLKAMEKSAETQALPLPGSVVESFLQPPESE